MAFTGTVRRPSPPRFSRRLLVAIIVVAAVVVAGVVTAAVLLLPRGSEDVHVSSTAGGSDLDALVSGDGTQIVWRSDAQTLGAWVEGRWSSERTVNHVRLSAAGRKTFESARLTFSDGSALLLSPNAEGVVDLGFPARKVDSVRLTVAEGVQGQRSVALASFVVSNGQDVPATTGGKLRPTASSSAPGSAATALVDGNPASGDLGAEWLAAPDATTAQAKLSWSGPRQVASVRIWGPTAAAFDPAYSAAAALNGSLRFSDGSTVRVSGIAGGGQGPTTVAFTPRMSSSVTVRLEKTIPQAVIGLRGIAVADADRAPAAPASGAPSQGATSAPAQAGAACGPTSPAVGTAAPSVIALVCPATGAAVSGTATVVVAAPTGTRVVASADTDGGLGKVAEATSGADGRAVLAVPVGSLPHGPTTLLVTGPDSGLRPLHVQLFNTAGRADAAAKADRGGSTLAWDEEFDRPLSISATGKDATYGATKPEYFGGSQFGDAVFDDPSSDAGTFSIVDDDYLRIRAQPLGDRPDPSGTNRKYLGGLLSSLRVGASGFSAQYGYYEARMMAPAGNGTWPAFWMMNDDSATKVTNTSAEVDAVELYGNRTKQTCHSIHDYVSKKDTSTVRCIESAIKDDWAVGWHTYGVQIDPGRAQFYVDGKLVMTETGVTHTDEPFFFMANLALGGGWPVDLTPVGNQADLWIDYIRVYV